MIKVARTSDLDPMCFEVTVEEHADHTRHVVTLSHEDYRRLSAPGCTPERCVRAAMQFLLEREPKESILARFDVSVISRYFPEFEASLGGYL